MHYVEHEHLQEVLVITNQTSHPIKAGKSAVLQVDTPKNQHNSKEICHATLHTHLDIVEIVLANSKL